MHAFIQHDGAVVILGCAIVNHTIFLHPSIHAIIFECISLTQNFNVTSLCKVCV